MLATAGACISLMAVISFRRARTTVNPLRPGTASTLVTGGIYRHTRNPMYLGLSIILLGWAVYLANAPALLLLPGFVLYIYRFQIVPEERTLAALFGAEYQAYRTRVRRWL
jgi:protein-S-isoprenylcysteine O-methyltransferase Ste14